MTQEEKAKAYDMALEKARKYRDEEGFTEMEDVFPELRESEDERIRKGLIKLLTVASEAYLVESTGIKKDSYLTYLAKQKEQKPAEWSEYDETAYSDLIWCIEQASKSAKDENDLGNIWFAENWVKNRLKSLRGRLKSSDNWKPSKEQMDTLLTATAYASSGEFGALNSLYEQLKKL